MLCFPTDTACKRRKKCQDRCKGWFGAQPDLERACKAACKEDPYLIKDSFLCSGNWVDDAIVIAAYGYDPCPDSGITVEDYLDPLGDRQREDQAVQKWQPVLIVGAVLILAAMGMFFFAIKK